MNATEMVSVVEAAQEFIMNMESATPEQVAKLHFDLARMAKKLHTMTDATVPKTSLFSDPNTSQRSKTLFGGERPRDRSPRRERSDSSYDDR